MAEPVAEVLAVAVGGDDVARDGVDLAARRARPHGVQRRLLGVAGRGRRSRQVVVELAGRPRARAVRAVAVDLRAEVERDEHPRRDLDVARLGVRERAVRAGGHDRGEARAGGAAAAHLLLERERDLALGAADDAALEHPRVDVVGERRGDADPLHLARLLAHALGLDERRRRRRARSARAAARAGAECWRTLMCWSSKPSRRRPSGQPSLSASANSCGARSRSKPSTSRLRALDVAEVGDEAARVRAHHRQRVRAREARQVADVDEVGDEQQVDLALPQAPRDAVGAAHSAALRCSSALAVALDALAQHARDHDVGEHGQVAPLLALLGVGEVHLDRGQPRHLDGVAQRPRVVGPGAGVEQEPVGVVGGAVQLVDVLALVVGLEEAHLEAELARVLRDLALELGQREVAVDLLGAAGRACPG